MDVPVFPVNVRDKFLIFSHYAALLADRHLYTCSRLQVILGIHVVLSIFAQPAIIKVYPENDIPDSHRFSSLVAPMDVPPLVW